MIRSQRSVYARESELRPTKEEHKPRMMPVMLPPPQNSQLLPLLFNKIVSQTLVLIPTVPNFPSREDLPLAEMLLVVLP